MDLESLKESCQIVTGTKQTARAVETGKAQHVFFARDADEKIVRPVADACQKNNIPITMVETMDELGKACNIKVSAAMAAILREK